MLYSCAYIADDGVLELRNFKVRDDLEDAQAMIIVGNIFPRLVNAYPIPNPPHEYLIGYENEE